MYGILNKDNSNDLSMKIICPAFKENASLPKESTCQGNNINPRIEISDIPKETKSLVVTMIDIDSFVGTWIHWLLWNIDPEIKVIEENSVPKDALQGTTSFDAVGYGGPCPHEGEHRYVFTVYALNTKIALGEGGDYEQLEEAIESKILDKAEYTGVYKKI